MSLRKGKKIIAGLPNLATESKSGLMSSADKTKLDALDPSNFVIKNDPITAGTHTKITYDSKGLVTGGSDLTASDIPDLSATYYSASNPNGYQTASQVSSSISTALTGYATQTWVGQQGYITLAVDDSSTTSTTKGWSASKLNGIIGNIETALDTIRGV